MCIFSVAYRVLPDCPIFVLTNRDESTERPTLSPQVFEATAPEGKRWFGGADQRAGGTWLGVNEHGLLAAVTNRKTVFVPDNPRSRGLLCRDVLEGATDQQLLGELTSGEYAGFNLIVLAPYSADVFEHADESLWRELTPGVHTIGNGSLDSAEDPRVQRTQELVEEMVSAKRGHGWTDCIEQAKAICRLPTEGNLPGICLQGEGWGTVSSSIIALALDSRESVYHYAAGPPCRTPYVDYSRSLRELLGQGATGAR
jgi:uncharacterized protein with NRDE domain